MEIVIKNYKNINKLNLTVENCKLNFYYGICGSGKSSLVGAITKECKDGDIAVGKRIEDVIINVDGCTPERNMFQSFDEKTVSNVIINESSDGSYYNIFLGDENEVALLESKYNEAINFLINNLDEIKLYKDGIDKLFSTFGKPGAKGVLTPKTKINLLSQQISASEEIHKEIVRIKGLDYVNWKLQGISIDDSFSKHQCPFCYQSITNKVFNDIEKFKTMVPKDFEVIFSNSDAFNILKIKEPDYYDEESLETFKAEIEKHKIVQLELEKIIQFCEFPKSQMFTEMQLSKLEISELVYDIFPEIENIINDINDNIEELVNLNKIMRGKAKTLLKGNERKLNHILKSLGIPYIFKPTIMRQSKTASISLCHIKDKLMTNMKHNLSYGEKNIVSLLIFLFGSDKNTLIIDDPASSYDDFRRKEIFDLLIEYAHDKTIILLSHDQVFLKYALLYKKQNLSSTKIGKICHFENYEGDVNINNIDFNHFIKLDHSIIEKIQSTDVYYRKILNARLLLEINKKGSEIEYGYLSAILHREKKCIVLKLLEGKGKTEEQIIQSIKKKYGIELPLMIDNYLENFIYDDLVLFEKAVYLREDEKKVNGNTELYKQLSNVVHLNEALIIGLDPYKYNCFSPFIYDAIKNYNQKQNNN